MIDDLSYRSIPAYGGQGIVNDKGGVSNLKTPTLDKMASEGLVFNHCYALPLCTPTRVAIMTGAHNGRNYQMGSWFDHENLTFADVFKDQGYVTGVFGKWKVSEQPIGDGERRRLVSPSYYGFDEWACTQMLRSHERYKNPVIQVTGDITLNTSDDDYGPDIMNQHALDFIRRHNKEKFFLYYPMALVHDPHHPPTSTGDAYKKDYPLDDKQSVLYGNRYFADMINHADILVGRLLNQLKTLGLSEQTLVVLTSDNGTKRKLVSRYRDANNELKSYEGGKGLVNDQGTHVPLLVWAPGLKQLKGQRIDDLVDITDIFPTLTAAIGVDLMKTYPNLSIDGLSFNDRILNARSNNQDRMIFNWYCNTPGEDDIVEYVYNKDYRWLKTTGPERNKSGKVKKGSEVSTRYAFYAADDLEMSNNLYNVGSPEQLALQRKMERFYLDNYNNRHVSELQCKVSELDVVAKKLNLRVGEQQQLMVKRIPAENVQFNALLFSSKKPEVAEVSPWGKVIARGKGETTITVTTCEYGLSKRIKQNIHIVVQ